MKMLTLVILISFPWISHAQGWRHHNNSHYDSYNHSFWHDVDKRQHDQHRRIDQGIIHGQLTRREARDLEHELKHVNRQIKRYRRRHHLSYAYQQKITHSLDHYSDQIRHLKHNHRYVNRDHHHHNRHTYGNLNKKSYYGSGNHLSWANNDKSAGFYLRF